ncbi:polysaccharide lyase family 7 protein [Paenibacillus cremeus]|uniref:Polysaccharide lyase family 7 protein n=1 Tax=Paenibacillus cremeus TaxID=2163881 RepID=A0A559K5V7_9BACL|nr:polysaccharide lyase family 7 protein [Paenibacillus cremeus]TVY07486.1 polysaccharide lyase family 7 protein [Paenibacillus cremeus]
MNRKVKAILATVTSAVMLLSIQLAPVCAAPNIDYHIWKLQQPDNTTISSSQLVSGYSSPYFYIASDGNQAFMDPQTGTPTSGSSHPRSELREITTSGANAAWSMTGTNTMTNTAKVTLQGGGTSGNTTIGQVFDSTGGFPLCEFEYEATPNSNGGNFRILYEESSGNGTYTYLSNVVPLNTQFTYKLSLSGGVLTVYVNGQSVFSKNPNLSGDQFYFKTGNYDQTATAGSNSTTPYTIVELNSVSVVHQ